MCDTCLVLSGCEWGVGVSENLRFFDYCQKILEVIIYFCFLHFVCFVVCVFSNFVESCCSPARQLVALLSSRYHH